MVRMLCSFGNKIRETATVEIELEGGVRKKWVALVPDRGGDTGGGGAAGALTFFNE